MVIELILLINRVTMFALGLRRSCLQLRGLTNQSFSRTILSSEYFCQQEWDKRLQEPVFSGVNAGKLFILFFFNLLFG